MPKKTSRRPARPVNRIRNPVPADNGQAAATLPTNSHQENGLAIHGIHGVVPASGISTHVHITKEDVLAITMSKAEKLCRADLVRTEADYKKCKRDLDIKLDVIAQKCEQAAKSTYRQIAQAIMAGLSPVYTRSQLTYTVDVYGLDLHKCGYYVHFVIRDKNNLCIISNLHKWHTLSTDIEKTHWAIRILQSQVQSYEEMLHVCKLRRKRLPLLKREYRAKLAEVQLTRTLEGREMLAMMQDRVVDDLEALVEED